MPISIRMLLSHTSGLPAHARLFEQAENNDKHEILRLACALPLAARPGETTIYSDIGFIILGEFLARAAGKPLDELCSSEIFTPLGMDATFFNPPAPSRSAVPPTLEQCPWRKQRIQGEVNDENAFAMGGVAGHAGVFSCARDLARFAQCLLRGGAPILKAHTLDLFTQVTPGNRFALGWDTPTPSSQSGKYFSPRSFGHLGYTGTSIWIDPERALAVILLTNRTWPDGKNETIKQIRPAFHDAIAEDLRG